MISSRDIVLVVQNNIVNRIYFDLYYMYLSNPPKDCQVYHLAYDGYKLPKLSELENKLFFAVEKVLTSINFSTVVPYMDDILPHLISSYTDYHETILSIVYNIIDALNSGKCSLSYCDVTHCETINYYMFLRLMMDTTNKNMLLKNIS